MRVLLPLLFALLFLAGGEVSATTSHPRHLFRVFRDLPGFEVSESLHGRSLSEDRTVSHASTHRLRDTNLHLSYDAKLSKAHFALLDPEVSSDIERIECAKDAVAVIMSSPKIAAETSASLFARELISGACSNEDADGVTEQPFYRRIKSVSVSGERVLVETENVGMKTLFDSLAFHFTWSPPHKDPLRPHQVASTEPKPTKAPSENVIGGDHKRSLRKDAPQRRRLFLDKIGDFFDNLGEDLVGGLKNLLSGALATVDDIKDYWEGIVDTVTKAIRGEDAKFDKTLNLFNLNFDTVTRKAKEPSIPLYHVPWATCEDCYFNIDVFVNLEFRFGLGGIPNKFVAEVGGEMDGKLFIKAKDPYIPADRNTMNNWHPLIERQLLGKFKFAIANVPVIIVVYGALNAAAETTEKITAEFTVGAQAHGHARFGARWDITDGWKGVKDMNWDSDYWVPKWKFEPNNAKVTAKISPEVIVSLYDFVPIVFKPKPQVSINFGTRGRSLPRIGEDDLSQRCEKNDEYALSAALKLGIGIGDIKFPANAFDMEVGGIDLPIDLSKFGLAGKTLIGGHDFGEIEIVKPHAFPSKCGPICNGCYADYLENANEWMKDAYGGSADYDYDHPGMAAIVVLLIVAACIPVVLFAAAIVTSRAAPQKWASMKSKHPRLGSLPFTGASASGGVRKEVARINKATSKPPTANPARSANDRKVSTDILFSGKAAPSHRKNKSSEIDISVVPKGRVSQMTQLYRA